MQQDDWRPVAEHFVEHLGVVALNTRHCRRDIEMQIENWIREFDEFTNLRNRDAYVLLTVCPADSVNINGSSGMTIQAIT